jgi:hypothetical protein
MNRSLALGALACALWMALAVGTGAWAQSKGEGVRPEVGKPLQAAQSLIKQRKGREAMAEIARAEAVPNRTPYENQVIAQMKAAAASVAGDHDSIIRTNEALLASGKTGREAIPLVQAVAVAYYNKKDYANAAKWTQRYFKEGGTEPAMRTVLLQSYFLGNDCASVNKMLGAAVEEGAGNGRKPAEEELQILANCYLKLKDTGGYVAAIEKLVMHYPKKEYWTDLLNRVQKKPGFSDRLALDVFRLKGVTSNIASAEDYMEYAQLALQGGVPAEAKLVVDRAYDKGVFGSGKEADRQKRLRDLVEKQLGEMQKERAQIEKDAAAAKDGGDLVKAGMNYVFEGQGDKGVKLIEQGIKLGGMKRPEDAKLHLGQAMIQAGQRGRAVTVLKGVRGTDGTADMARLWALHAQRS